MQPVDLFLYGVALVGVALVAAAAYGVMTLVRALFHGWVNTEGRRR